MAGALPAKKGRPEREAGERVAAHAMTTKPPRAERVAVWKREMSEAENAEFEEAAGYLLDELGYETATPRENWLPPEEWARSKTPVRAGARRERLRTAFGARSRVTSEFDAGLATDHGIGFSRAERGTTRAASRCRSSSA